MRLKSSGGVPTTTPNKTPSSVRKPAGWSTAGEYYLGEGANDQLIIELPKGGYVPAFRQVEANTAPRRAIPKRHYLLAAAIACIVTSLAVLVWWRAHRQNPPVTIAVLPLENLNHDPAYDYLADGLTDEIIRNLSTFDGLEPRSRTSSFALKGKAPNIREAGKELSAEYIVEGSILRSGVALRVDAQLIRVRDDVPVWSGKFDREAADAIAVQDEISRAIVNNLRIKLGRGRRRYETSPEAYDLYLHARASGFRQSIGHFEEAIAKDPSFAPAYAGLAVSYARRTSTVYFDRSDELTKMRAAAEKAIELDPLLAEAQDALGIAYARDGRWTLSEKSFRRAAELEPNRKQTYGDFAMFLLLPLGRIPEALDWMRVAQRADPLSPEARSQLTSVLLSSHQYDEAARQCEGMAEPSKSECLGRARLGQGRNAEAVDILAAAVNRGVPLALLSAAISRMVMPGSGDAMRLRK